MNPKAKLRLLPLLLLVSITAVSLYTLSCSSHIENSNFAPHSPHGPTPTPHNFTLTLKLLAYDRLPSISRCLRSLAAAEYSGDSVHLDIFLDHFPASNSSDPGPLLRNSRQILDFVDAFPWKFGQKRVHYRTVNVGLQAQWLEAWWPSSDHDFAFVVEDDLELSPLYYAYLKKLILTYYYDSDNFSPSIYGASLQRPRFVAGKHGNKLQLDNGTQLFLYQMVGTWGQLLFPKHWKEFRLWYDLHKAKGIKPVLEGMVTTGWYKRMGERIWTPWFIKFIHSHGYFNIYTNFLHERALSTSHRDAGVNYGKTEGPDSYLLNKNSLDFDLWEMPPLRKLKWYDFCFSEVLPGRVVRTFDELQSVLYCMRRNIVVFISLFRTSDTVLRNLICHFQSSYIRNYIFIGANSELLVELARWGHPVIDTAPFMDELWRSKSMSFQGSMTELTKEVIFKAHVMKKCIEFGFDSWMIDGNILPVAEGFPDVRDLSSDFIGMSGAEVLCIKSSQTSKKVWINDFISKLASTTQSLIGRDNLSSYHQRHFAYISAMSLKEKGMDVKWIDELSVGLEIGGSYNKTTLESGKKMVFWPSNMASDFIQRNLESLGLWMIDGDAACVAVVCHWS